MVTGAGHRLHPAGSPWSAGPSALLGRGEPLADLGRAVAARFIQAGGSGTLVVVSFVVIAPSFRV
jgi:hypothetical protein